MKSFANLGQNSAYQTSGRLLKDNRAASLRQSSLPPSALPRPARSLKPPRKIEYDRLSDSSNKARSTTPPKMSSPFDLRAATMKRNEYSRRDFASPAKNYVEMKEMLNFPNPHFSLKKSVKDYGSMNKSEFSKPEHTSTKYYQRLEESPKMNKTSDSSGSSSGFKRSLLPSASARKYSPATASNSNKQHSRDSLNSSESNQSANSNLRQSPLHLKVDVHNPSSASTSFHQHINSRTPPKYMSLAPQDKTASLPPKPIDNRTGRRGGSVTRGENRYKIQF